MRHERTRYVRAVRCLVVGLIWATSLLGASADDSLPQIVLQVDGTKYVVPVEAVPADAGTPSVRPFTASKKADDGTWSFTVSGDYAEKGASASDRVSVALSAGVQNLLGAAVSVTLTITIPTEPIASPRIRGSVVGTVTDASSDVGAVSTTAPFPIYAPTIDGVEEMAGYLLTDPFSVLANGSLLSNTIGPASFGVESEVIASQDVDESYGIVLRFDLSARDFASFGSVFELERVDD